MNRTKVFQTKFGQGCWIDISVQQDPYSKVCGVTFISTGTISKAGVFTISKTDRHLLRTSKSSYKKQSYENIVQ